MYSVSSECMGKYACMGMCMYECMREEEKEETKR